MARIPTNIVREYKDLDLSFQAHPVRKDVNKHTGALAVVNAVKNIVLTAHYEKPFQPDVGSNIRKLLFENLDVVTAASIEREIEQTINNYEPRVKILKVSANPDFDNNGFKVELQFSIVNLADPITINLFLERIR